MFSSIVRSILHTKQYSKLLFSLFMISALLPVVPLNLTTPAPTDARRLQTSLRNALTGVHDLSSVKRNKATKLPRFNMPLELGLFLGCKRYSGPFQNDKKCLILESQRYRFQKYISDISGQDVSDHEDDFNRAIVATRDWLCTASKKKKLPGGQSIVDRYRRFREDLPSLCSSLKREKDSLIFSDWSEMFHFGLS